MEFRIIRAEIKDINDEELLQLAELELNQEIQNKAIKQHKFNQMANYVLSIASLFACLFFLLLINFIAASKQLNIYLFDLVDSF